MLKVDKFLSHLQIFYTDCKFLRCVTSNPFSLSWWYVLKTSLQDILKMSWRRLKDVFAKRSWRRLGKTSWRCLEVFASFRLANWEVKTERVIYGLNLSISVWFSWIWISSSDLLLRTLTEKKHRQIKLQRLQNVEIWAFG